MPKVTIDKRTIDVEEGTTILEAAKRLGIFIPHFCYHPSLPIAGNCRLCSVEVEGQAKPVISCKEVVKDGMVVRTDSEMAVSTRRSVLEFVLINHPIDCPVCDQSGECKLQDYYFDHSLQPSRLSDEKVHKPKAVPIGPNVILDAERCVECTRCVRFCQEITKTNEMTIKERTDHSEITIYPGKELNNPYSMCTVDLCPVGALTGRDFRFKKRVWFLTSTPSVCDNCATGCNIFIDHCDGVVYRYRPRENPEVNGPWMCDEGRLSYKKINAADRVLYPMLKENGNYIRTSWCDATAQIIDVLKTVDPKEVAVILSAGSSVEENGAFAAFFRDVIKTPNIFMSSLPPDEKFADKLLRDADRNSNVRGLASITDRRMTDAKGFKLFFVVEGMQGPELMSIVSAKPKGVILIASRFDVHQQYADVVLPKATFAEQSGAFVNRKGNSQRFERAIEPVGESLTGAEMVETLKEAFK